MRIEKNLNLLRLTYYHLKSLRFISFTSRAQYRTCTQHRHERNHIFKEFYGIAAVCSIYGNMVDSFWAA